MEYNNGQRYDVTKRDCPKPDLLRLRPPYLPDLFRKRVIFASVLNGNYILDSLTPFWYI